MFDLEERTSLLSLLELLNLSEYFVTVDHSVQWQRHISWSKPDGAGLRHYVTQRYSSNMVFLSCMLAAQINVFFNSSKELTDMRSLLGVQSHGILRYWIGIVLLVDISTTIIALVSTFTLWGMVSSLSDANTHALLRSSIGQYVTSLPPKFSVAALYLFLLWIILFVADLVKGPVQGCLLFLILFMFFQVVIPLSAFGRLIIHTGAMATRPVLDKELERDLLSSGLHASLLIRATDRRRKYSNATDQYRKQNKKSRRLGAISGDSVNASGASLPSQQYSQLSIPQLPPRDITFNVPKTTTHSDDLSSDGSAASSINNDGTEIGDGDDNSPLKPISGHRRMETFDTVGSDNFFFPSSNVLNAAMSRGDIHNVVRQSIKVATEHNVPVVRPIIPMGENDPIAPPPPPPLPEVDNAAAAIPNRDGIGRTLPALAVSLNTGQTTNTLVVEGTVEEEDIQNNLSEEGGGNGGSGSHHRSKANARFIGTKPSTTFLENTPTQNEGGDSIGVGPSNDFKATIMSSFEQSHSPGFVNLRKTVNNVNFNAGSGVSSHPLLMSPVRQRPPTHRPPKRNSITKQQRQRGASHSRSQSLLGLFPMKSVFDELEEENEVRELYEAPPAVNTEERLSREYNNLTPRSLSRKHHHNKNIVSTTTSPNNVNIRDGRQQRMIMNVSSNNNRPLGPPLTIEEETSQLRQQQNDDVEEGKRLTGSDNIRRRANSEPVVVESPEETTHLLASDFNASENRLNNYGG